MKNTIDKIFYEFDSHKIKYAILRGADELYTSNDIDVLIDKNELSKLAAIFEKNNFIKLKTPGHWPSSFYLHYSSVERKWIKFDIMHTVAYGAPFKCYKTDLAQNFIANRELKNNFYVLKPYYELLNLTIHALIDKEKPTLKYKGRIFELSESLEADLYKLDAELKGILSQNFNLTSFLVHLRNDDLEGLKVIKECIEKHYKRSKLFYSYSNFSQLLLRKYYTHCKGLLFPKINLALIGTDGVGKSSISSALEKDLPFNVKNVYMGWGDAPNALLLPTSKWLAKKYPAQTIINDSNSVKGESDEGIVIGEDGKQLKPSKNINAKSSPFLKIKRFISFSNEYFEQLARYSLARYYKFKGCIVIFDRYIYDQAVFNHCIQGDKVSTKNKVFEFIYKYFFPSADLTILLEADPVEINRRKDELEVDDIAARIKEYKIVCNEVKNFVIVDANQDLETVTADIINLIWQELHKK